MGGSEPRETGGPKPGAAPASCQHAYLTAAPGRTIRLQPMKTLLKTSALSAALFAAQPATPASGLLSADLAPVDPTTANTSSPSNWRFAPGQLFNGVAALDGVALLEF